MQEWMTCRFCGKTAHHGSMVKYGVRHYAHHDCYLDHRDLSQLYPWQIRRFPWQVLKERGLTDKAAALIEEEGRAWQK
jgi:hypothetical protein